MAIGSSKSQTNQTGRAPNKWGKSGVIVECKPHNQINVMMDGSRRVSLRNQQFVRKTNIPIPVMLLLQESSLLSFILLSMVMWWISRAFRARILVWRKSWSMGKYLRTQEGRHTW